MQTQFNLRNLAFRILVYAIIFFLFGPIFVLIVVSFSQSGFVLPPSGMTLRWYIQALTYRDFISGMYVSFLVAFFSSTIATSLGVLISFPLVRRQFRHKEAVNAFLMSPLMIPVAIMGLSLYSFLVTLHLADSVLALIIGHTVMVMPFSVRTVSASLQTFDKSLEEAAMNVGLGPLRTAFRITLPIIKVGIFAGMVISFIISWNNFALSIFLSSAKWIPLPLHLYFYIKYDYDPSGAALSAFLIFLSWVAIVIIDKSVGLGVAMGIQKERR